MTKICQKYELQAVVNYRKRPATVVGRCYVSNEWLYDLRLPSGKIVQYVPERMVTA